MKKTLPLIAAVLLLNAIAASAQGTSVTIQLTPSSTLLASKVTTFFSKNTNDFPFTALKPRSSMTLEGLPEGSHLLVGFFVAEEKTEFPVRVLALTVDTRLAQRMYNLYSEPALLQLPRGVGRLARFGSTPSLAQKETAPAVAAAPTPTPTPAATPAPAKTPSPAPQAPAPTPAPAPTSAQAAAVPHATVKITTFASAFAPVSFTREEAGTFSVLPISDSKFWNRDGTRIAEIDGAKSGTGLVVDIVSASGFSKDVSYFFYLFSAREEGQDNSYTIELKPALAGGEGGIAVLWEKENPSPVPVGKVTVTGETCTLSATLSDLPSDVTKALGSNPSTDITACFFDSASQTYEEFYYATLSLAEVPEVTR
jgi:hypothetical protein